MRPPSATAALPSAELGARLRKARVDKGLSQREAAVRIGVTKRGYEAWERAENGITYDHLQRVAEVLEVTVDWLKLGDELEQIPAADYVLIREGVVQLMVEAKTTKSVADRVERMEEQLQRIEDALGQLVVLAHGDETRTAIDVTRAVKEAASASAGAGAAESEAAGQAHDEGDAKTGSPRSRQPRKRSSGG